MHPLPTMLQKTSKFAVFQLPSPSQASPSSTSASSSVAFIPRLPKDEAFDPSKDVEQPMADLRSLLHKEDVFHALYCNYSSAKTAYISLQERKAINADKTHALHKASSLTYGEIRDLESVQHTIAVLREHDLLPPEGQGVFYDIGSGSGKVVFAAALVYPFRLCRGIEILPSLHEIGLVAQNHYQKYFSQPQVELFVGSILDLTVCDWTDGDVVFANSTCFSDDLFAQVSKIAMKMRKGSVMITLSQILPPSTGFELFKETREHMSWGDADYYFHIKKTESGETPDETVTP